MGIKLGTFSNKKKEIPEEFKELAKDFAEKGFITTLRVTRGDAVDGACGQLVGKLKKSIKGKNLINAREI